MDRAFIERLRLQGSFPPIPAVRALRYSHVMPRVLEWTEADVEGLSDSWGLTRIVTEVDDNGSVTRELGFDAQGRLVHRYPGEPKRAKHGVFDHARIGLSDRVDMHAAEFERLWSA